MFIGFYEVWSLLDLTGRKCLKDWRRGVFVRICGVLTRSWCSLDFLEWWVAETL